MSQVHDYKGALPQSTIHVDIEEPTTNVQENKQVTITQNTNTIVEPDVGYDALAKVTVTTNVNPNQTLTNKRITSTGTYTVSDWITETGKIGISGNSTIIVDTPTYDITQISNYPISSNGTKTIPIPSGYDAVNSITVNVNVPPPVCKEINVGSTSFNTNTMDTHNSYAPITLDNNKTIILIRETTNYYRVYVKANTTGSSTTISSDMGDRYKIINRSYVTQVMLNSVVGGISNSLLILDPDNISTNDDYIMTTIYKRIMTFNF